MSNPSNLPSASGAGLGNFETGSAVATKPQPIVPPSEPKAEKAPPPRSVPYKLPSRGLYYQKVAPGHDGLIYVSPTTGSQETIMSGLREEQIPPSVLKHLLSQCIETRGIPIDELTIPDWVAATAVFYAQSVGTDVITVTPNHCNKEFSQTIGLSDIPSTILEITNDPKEANWPSDPEESEIIEALRYADNPYGIVTRKVLPKDLQEPYLVELSTGDVIHWRLPRLRDLIAAEEFFKSLGKSTHDALALFIVASSIESINGRFNIPLTERYLWASRCDSPTLSEIRSDMEDYSFGFDISFRFTCPTCSSTFRQEVALDANVFRKRAKKKARRRSQ